MKVLAIGNSFSNDAMRYLHGIAKADGVDMKTVNLFIGGCPLSRHYANIHNDAADYDFEFNGGSSLYLGNSGPPSYFRSETQCSQNT